jgi:hypothetical protein
MRAKASQFKAARPSVGATIASLRSWIWRATMRSARSHSSGDEYDRLRRIDDAFLDFTDNLLNPQDPIAPLLMLQAHASYRAAVELAMTCQSAPAFMTMRGCIESSLYGFYFHRNPNTFEV